MRPSSQARHLQAVPLRRGPRLSRRTGGLAVLILPLMTLLSGCDEGHPSAPAQASRPVLVTRVHYAPIVRSRSFVATIRPRIESDLGFRVPGKIAKRLVENGQRVSRGDMLARLDDTDAHLQAEQAEAELAAARTSLEQAAADARRGEELQRSGWTPQATIDKLRAGAQEARGRLVRAERAVDLARNILAYQSLTADTDGVVTAALVEDGQVVAAGQPAIRLARLDEKEAVVSVPETMLKAVEGARASLTLWARPDETYPLTLRELSATADAATRTYAARFSIPTAGERLSLGMSGTVTLTDPGDQRGARLPLSALFNQGTGPGFWTVDAEGGLTLKPATILSYETDAVLVGTGLAEGDRVVVLGVQKLDPRQRVRPLDKL